MKGQIADEAIKQQHNSSSWRVPPRAVFKTCLYIALLVGLTMAPSMDWTWAPVWFTMAVTVATAIVPGWLYVSKHNPGLIAERERFLNNQGTAGFEKLLVPFILSLMSARYLAAGLQHRWAMQQPGWLPTPFLATPDQQLAAACAVLGSVLQTWSVCTNKYFSSVVRIQSDRGHKVCSEGPYAWVRHPGYVAFVTHDIAEALLLQSPWALVLTVAEAAAMVVRTAYEDAFLQRSLPGYADYARQVRYRLVPGLW